ncbi:type III secretion system export apparatus subunit SctT [Burkholderia ambifaria]|uniref:type III secretion system export apparatus subunit SctT n=1 Tax=Burkholderia ambifaria TaxID=152480 RepID=UPI0015927251|nr:type III secretion system export apparatus subunit SctT [Burkholderia ambifaria]
MTGTFTEALTGGRTSGPLADLAGPTFTGAQLTGPSAIGGFEEPLLLAGIVLARLAPVVLFLPLFSARTLGQHVVRASLLALLSFALVPALDAPADALLARPFLLTVAGEGLVGLLLGFVFSAPYWAVLACGELLDNQRGATIANSIDPVAGVEASPLATFFGFVWSALFVMGGGLLELLELLAESYRLAPVLATGVTDSVSSQPGSAHAAGLDTLPHVIAALARLTGRAVLAGAIAAAPALLAMLLTEMLLGILSRFAPQLNVFAVALTVKSVIACIMLLLCFNPLIFTTIRRATTVPLAPLLTWTGASP